MLSLSKKHFAIIIVGLYIFFPVVFAQTLEFQKTLTSTPLSAEFDLEENLYYSVNNRLEKLSASNVEQSFVFPQGVFISKLTTGVDNSIYLFGRFSGTVDFDLGPGVQNRTARFSDDMFLVKYSSDMSFVSFTLISTFHGNHQNSVPLDILVSEDGGVFVTFYSRIFQGGTERENNLYLLSYNSDFTLQTFMPIRSIDFENTTTSGQPFKTYLHTTSTHFLLGVSYKQNKFVNVFDSYFEVYPRSGGAVLGQRVGYFEYSGLSTNEEIVYARLISNNQVMIGLVTNASTIRLRTSPDLNVTGNVHIAKYNLSGGYISHEPRSSRGFGDRRSNNNHHFITGTNITLVNDNNQITGTTFRPALPSFNQYFLAVKNSRYAVLGFANTSTNVNSQSPAVNVTGNFIAKYNRNVNNAPIVSTIANPTICRNQSAQPISFTITDETPATVTLSALSSNTSVLPNAGITFGGSGSNRTITLNSTSVGSSNVTITATDAQGLSSTRVFNATFNTSPAVDPIITGENPTCTGIAKIYSLSSVSTGVNFTWSASGGTINSQTNASANITWNQAGTRTITATPSNTCGTGTPITTNINVSTAPTILTDITFSPGQTCIGNTRAYSVFDDPGSNFNWTVSSGGTITFNRAIANVAWTSAGTHTVTVTPSNQCGTGTPKSVQITVSGPPAQPSTISGNASVNQNTSSSYQVTNVSGVTYQWSVTGADNTVSGSTNQATASWGTTGSQTLSVSAVNSCGASTTRTLTVNVQGTCNVVQPIVTGSQAACAGNQAYAVSNPQSGYTYSWSIMGGAGTFVSGNSGTNVTITWSGTGSRTVVCTPTAACGIGNATNYPVTLNSLPAQPSEISGSATPCFGTNLYSVTPVSGVVYNWSVSGTANITGNGNEAILNLPNTAGSYTITVTPNNACGNGTPRTRSVNLLQVPAQPNVITGNSTVCQGANNQSYTITGGAVAGVAYNWSVSGTNNSIVGNIANATAAFNTAGSHAITVIPSNACGSGPSRQLNVQINNLPQTPQLISGRNSLCVNANEEYVVSAPSTGVTLNWVANGGSVSGTDAAKRTVTWTSTGARTLTITPNNTCGNGTALTVNVTVDNLPGQPSVIGGPASTDVGVLNSYAVSSVSGVTFNWNAGTGGSIVGTGSSIQASWSTSGTKTLTVTPSNACGNGTSRSTSVTVNGSCSPPAKPTSLIGPTGILPGGGVRLYTAPFVSGVSYDFSVSPSNGVTIISTTGNQVSITFDQSGIFTLFATPRNACGSGESFPLEITVCDVPFTATPTISGPSELCINSNSRAIFTVAPRPSGIITWESTSFPALILESGQNTTQATFRAEQVGSLSYRVRYTDACNQNGNWATGTINAGNLPALATLNSIAGDKCINTSNTFNIQSPIGGVTYHWRTSEGASVNSQTGTSNAVNWLSTGTRSVFVRSQNQCGFSNETQYNHIVSQPFDLPGRIIGPEIVCRGSNHVYTYSGSVSTGNIQWSAPSSLSPMTSTTGNPITYRPLVSSGEFNIQASWINSCGAGKPLILKVKTLDVFPPTIAPASSACLNQEATYSISPVEGASNYNWSAGSFGTVTQNNSTTGKVIWRSVGVYNLNVSALNTCLEQPEAENTATQQVTVSTVPNIPVFSAGPITACLNQATTYTVTNTTGVTYAWSLPDGGGTITPSGNSASVTFNQTGVFKVRCLPSNTCGMGTAVERIVTVTGAPNASSFVLVGPEQICANINTSYNTSNQSGITFTWQITGGTILGTNPNTADVNFSAGSNRSIKLIGTNSCGSAEISKTVNILTIPAAPTTISGLDAACIGQTNYVASQVSGANYEFSFVNGRATVSNTIGNTAIVNLNTAGAETIRVRTSNQCGTSTFTTKNITINTIPANISLASTLPVTVCKGVVTNVTVNNPSNATLTWNASNDVPFIVPNGNQASITWAKGGAVTLTVTASNSCGQANNSIMHQTRVDSVPNILRIDGIDEPVCEGTKVSYSIGNSLGTTFRWNAPSGASYTLPQTTQAVFEPTWLNGGDALPVSVIATNQCGADTLNDFQVVYSNDISGYEIEGEANSATGTTNSYGIYQSLGANYVWSVEPSDAGVVVSNLADANVFWLKPGTHIVKVTSSNPCSETVTEQLEVTVTGEPLSHRPSYIGSKSEMMVYPNPSSGEIRIVSATTEPMDLMVLNMMGEKLAQHNNYVSGSIINLHNLSAGSYVLVIKTSTETFNKIISIVK